MSPSVQNDCEDNPNTTVMGIVTILQQAIEIRVRNKNQGKIIALKFEITMPINLMYKYKCSRRNSSA